MAQMPLKQMPRVWKWRKSPIMRQTSVFLKPEQMGRLQKLSRITGEPVAELIRRAIDAYMEQRMKEFGRG
jgi:predicted DNA-binding protein